MPAPPVEDSLEVPTAYNLKGRLGTSTLGNLAVRDARPLRVLLFSVIGLSAGKITLQRIFFGKLPLC
jgi:hypothetical protein